jgi:hypothetical protein
VDSLVSRVIIIIFFAPIIWTGTIEAANLIYEHIIHLFPMTRSYGSHGKWIIQCWKIPYPCLIPYLLTLIMLVKTAPTYLQATARPSKRGPFCLGRTRPMSLCSSIIEYLQSKIKLGHRTTLKETKHCQIRKLGYLNKDV